MTYSCGIDIADLTFTASCLTGSAADGFTPVFLYKTLNQSPEGWQAFMALLGGHNVQRDDVRIIMEATGVYSEKISYYLYEHGYTVYVEPPQKVKYSFYAREKSDPVDSRQIAEYGFRYTDRLHRWRPPNEIIEQIQVMLAAREQFSKIQTACKNSLKSLRKKQRQFEHIETFYEDLGKEAKQKNIAIEQEIKRLVAQNPRLQQIVIDLLTFKSLGFLLIAYLLVATDGFRLVEYRKLASYIGICPFKYTSGTSVKGREHADAAGPASLRKQLYLASMRMMRTHPDLKLYYARKLAEKKSGKLALNNLANKILRIVCGMIQSGKPYMKNYRSSKPEKNN